MKRDLARDTSQRLTWLASIDVPLAAAIAAMPAAVLAAHLPSSLLLPALAAFAFVAAGLAAALGILTRTARNAATVTIWDVAGACVLIGIAAGAFSESVYVSQLLGIATTNP